LDMRLVAEMLNGKVTSTIPMLQTHPDDRSERYDDYEYISRKIYVSHFLGDGLTLGDENYSVGPWFTLALDNLNTVYFTDVMKYSFKGEPSEVLEMYIYSGEYYEYYDENGNGSGGYTYKLIPLCCSEKMGDNIDAAMSALYRTVYRHRDDIRIPENLKGILDEFMKSEH